MHLYLCVTNMWSMYTDVALILHSSWSTENVHSNHPQQESEERDCVVCMVCVCEHITTCLLYAPVPVCH